jgi:hypothetical protein
MMTPCVLPHDANICIISCFGAWLKSFDSCRSCAFQKLATAIASSLYEKLLGS